MTLYLIAFPSHAMDHLTEADLAEASETSHAVVREAKDAGVFRFGGGLADDVAPVLVGTDGSVTDGCYPETAQLNGGMMVLDVPTREAALEWAAKVAASCRCAQEVREFMYNPES